MKGKRAMKRWSKSIAIFPLLLLIVGGVLTLYFSQFACHPLKRSEEVVLMRNLWTMRRAIDFYWQDKEKPPANLQELVSAGYLREVPKDPMCSDCQWNEVPAPADDTNSAGGVGDVKSTAPGKDSNGKPFTDY
jgi:general secretion pathway protein G